MSRGIPFFDNLPPKAIKPACRLWDAVHSPAYNGVLAYSDFCQDLTFASIQPPPRSTVKRWVAGVQAGLIERPEPGPLAPVADPLPPAPRLDEKPVVVPRHQSSPITGKAERRKADVLVSHPVTGDAVRPEIASHLDPNTRQYTGAAIVIDEPDGDTKPDAAAPMSVPALVAVKSAAGHLVEQLVAELSAGIERTARKEASRLLRALADDLDGDASPSDLKGAPSAGQMIYVSARAN